MGVSNNFTRSHDDGVQTNNFTAFEAGFLCGSCTRVGQTVHGCPAPLAPSIGSGENLVWSKQGLAPAFCLGAKSRFLGQWHISLGKLHPADQWFVDVIEYSA